MKSKKGKRTGAQKTKPRPLQKKPFKTVPAKPNAKEQLRSAIIERLQEVDAKLKSDAGLSSYQKYQVRVADPWRSASWFSEFFAETQPRRAEELDHLDALIRDGDFAALQELVFLARESTRRLTDWARKSSAFVKVIASESESWPLLCTLSASQNAALLPLLGEIGLDSSLPLVAKSTAVGLQPTPARNWAVKLLRRIGATREALGKGRPRHSALGIRVIDDSSENPRVDLDFPELKERILQLDEFSMATISQWWKVAKDLFLKLTHYRPFDEPDLNSYSGTKRAQSLKGNKRDGVRRGEVMKVVKQAFMHLAPKPSAVP